jgi:cytochrome c5
VTSVKPSFKSIALAAAALTATLLAGSALAQSAADNIRPVGSVCLQGQACVGQPVSGSGTAAAPAASASNAAPEQTAPPAATAAEPEPSSASVAEAASDFDVEATYNQSCMACHTTGAAGAPVLGDTEAWNERLEKGMDQVLANAINGIGAMPARGLCMSCSDDDLQALIDYMIEP